MAGSTEYSVVVNYLTKGEINLPNQQLGQLNRGFNNVASSFGTSMSSALDGIVTTGITAATAIGGAFAAAMTYAIASVHAEMETTGIALATIFGARGVAKDFNDSMNMSAEVLQMIRKDARELPGEFKDLVGIMQSISSAGFMSGMSTREVEKFSAQTMAMAAVAKIPYEVAAREMAAMLEGNVRQQNILYRRLFAGVGTPKELNAMSSSKRRETIEGEMNKPAYQDAIKAYATTFTGLFTTLKDHLRLTLLMPLTAPVFESVKSALKEINDWFGSHGAEIEIWTTRIGNKLGRAFEYVVEKVDQLFPTMQTIGGYIESLFMDGKALDRLEKLAMALGTMRLGALGISAIGSLVGGSEVAGGVGAAAAGAGGIGAAILAPEGLALAAEAFIDLGVVLMAVWGAVDNLTDSTALFHEEAVRDWNDIIKNTEAATTALKDSWDRVKGPLREVADALGIVLLDSIVLLTAGVAKFAETARDFLKWMGYVPTVGSPEKDMASIHQFKTPSLTDLDRKSKDTMKAPVHNTTIHKVEIVVNSNQDPSRIARLVQSELVQLAINRKSGSTQNWSAATPSR